MDRESRFLIASKLSEHRDIQSCVEAFNEAIHNSNGQLPQKVHTDSYRAYREGVKVLENVEHVANCGITKPHESNNHIERLNGTLRERTKVQRGWKSKKTLIAEGQRIHYNFVKPHEALQGQTPADKVGVGLKSKNKWAELLKMS
jgi:Integrase core domain.